MLNRIVLIGRLVRDPELNHTPNGIAVAKFTLAVDRPFTNKDGERDTDFINIQAWRKLAENCDKYLSKGRLVGVDGRLQIRTYEQDGHRKYFTEVVADTVQFLERGRKQEDVDPEDTGLHLGSDADIPEEEIPF